MHVITTTSELDAACARLARHPFVTVDHAAQIMWAYSSPEIYDLFVVRRGWTPQQLGEFVASALAAALLPMQ